MAEAPRDQNFVPAALFEVDGSPGEVSPGQIDTATGRILVDLPGGGSGTVTTVSVVTANGFAGTVANATTTPAITLTTTITGILQGNGTAISAASTTGSGSVVLATSPTLVTPVLGVATATSLNGLTITTSTGTLTVANGKTLTVSNSLTLAGTDATTITFQGTDTYVGRTTTDTLTNKTLTAPRFADLGFIADSNGNEMLIFDLNASAVNELTISNAATANNPLLQSTGGDTNIGLDLSSKGTGSLILWSGAKARELLILPDVASAVNEVTISGSATGVGVTVAASGGDTNIDLRLSPKGTGKVVPTGQVNHGAFTAYFTETDNGNSGTSDTIDWGLSNKQRSTLTGNCTFTFTAPPGPCSLILQLRQDATGSRTVTWPASVKWSGGTAPTLTTTASRMDLISFYYDGTNYYGAANLNFTP